MSQRLPTFQLTRLLNVWFASYLAGDMLNLSALTAGPIGSVFEMNLIAVSVNLIVMKSSGQLTVITLNGCSTHLWPLITTDSGRGFAPYGGCCFRYSSTWLNDDASTTVFCEAANIINSRPKTKCNDDADNLEPLTANHLLDLKGNYSYPWANPIEGNLYQRKWRAVMCYVNTVWKRRLKEYLPDLQRRQKWPDVKPNIRIGDMV